MRRAVREAVGLAAGAGLRLLALLSLTFLVYRIGRGDESVYHPLYLFWRYLVGLISLAPGTTPQGVEASFYIVPALLRTGALLAGATAAALAIGMALARWNFIRYRERAVRRLERIGSLAYALPVAVLATFLFVVASETGWFPVGGTASAGFGSLGPAAAAVDLAHHYVLPWATLTLFPALVLIRSGLQSVAETRFAEHVVIAQSHGFDDRTLFRTHAHRPLIARLLGELAAHLPLFVTYLVIVELVFRYTGVGYYLVRPYSGFWGARGEEAFVLSQAALVYVGGISIVAQLVVRLIRLWLVPRTRGTGGESGSGGRALALGTAFAVCAGGLVSPLARLGGSGGTADVIGAAVALIAGAVIVALALRTRPGGEATRSGPRITDRSDAAPTIGGAGRPRFRTGILETFTGAASIPVRWIAGAILAAVVVLPWILSEPARPPAIMMLQPRAIDHPYLVGYFFLRTLAAGRFLVVVLVATLTGAAVGGVLGTLAGYYRIRSVDRGVGYVEVVPAILVAILVAGVTSVVGLPIFVALASAAAIRFYASVRDSSAHIAASDYARYAVAIGERSVEQFVRHVLPNEARNVLPLLVALYSDLIVLAANLSFLRLVPVGASLSGESAAGPFRALTFDWASLLAIARSDFIRGIYLPAFWPLVFLIVTIAALRLISPRGGSR